MEHHGTPWNTMEYWHENTVVFSIVTPWDHDCNTVGLLLEFRWITIGIPLDYVWNSVGLRLEFRWITIGIPLDYYWNSVGTLSHPMVPI
jgi:hypothetical protein